LNRDEGETSILVMTASSEPAVQPTTPDEFRAAVATLRPRQGAEFQVPLVRVNRHTAVFETHVGQPVLRLSEVLGSCEITVQGQAAYAGEAVVRSLLNTGATTLCELTLQEGAWCDLVLVAEPLTSGVVAQQFNRFIRTWSHAYQVRPEIKIIVADLQSLLGSLRLWLEQVELGGRGSSGMASATFERQFAGQLGRSVFPFLDELFDRLECATAKFDAMDRDLRPIHAAYVRQQLQPLVKCSPFAARAIHKPLGYAGDYEVVNMILGDPHIGDSLYARMLNRWFLKQPPAEAHRNRIQHLTQRLSEESARCVSQGRELRVYNLGCGPAGEIQDFMARHAASNLASFTLVDFNEETIRHGQATLEAARQRAGRRTKMQFQKKSVAQVLRARDGAAGPDGQYDLVYCAGLFDYLSDPVCARLMNIFYEMLAPGGLVLATNVDRSNPIRHWLEDVLEWPLIYRDSREMARLQPEQAGPDGASVLADAGTGVNIFLEVRKPVA